MAQTIRVLGTRHVIEVDAVPAFGGKDRHAGPLAYALGALTSCSQATAQVVARELGVRIDHIRFELESEIDLAGLVGAPFEGRPDFQSVELRVSVQTPASAADVQQLRAETERRRPVFQLFSRAGVPIRSLWVRSPVASVAPVAV